MDYRRLGTSGVTVSSIGMGTMTFGSQADEKASFAIMNRAYEAGVTFYDVAEMYPVPPTAELFGVSEEIVGKWLKTKPRESVIVATKITGPGHGWFRPPVRHGMTALDRVQISRAVEASLQRLGTDYIDLYQTHWPDHGGRYEDVLAALGELVDAGKIRVIGCSNETCWGLMKSLWVAESHGLPRYDTVQNNFSLLNRRCESELAQVCRRESVGLIAYSPLAGGVLTGKYQDGALPGGARFTDYIAGEGERQRRIAARFVNPRTLEATSRFLEIARDLGTTGAALATEWSRHHDFVASTLVGATTLPQLEESLAAESLELDETTLAVLDAVEDDIPLSFGEDGLRKL